MSLICNYILVVARIFVNTNRGEGYEEIIPIIHIGFLDFTLFKDTPEFYSEFKIMNVKTHYVYSGKFVLRVINLSQIELATDEDKAFQIDYWARLFKADTWEELKMLAKDNEYLQEAAESLYIANADEMVRQQCYARQDAEKRERYLVKHIKITEEKLAKTQEELVEKDNAIAEKDKLIFELQTKLSKLEQSN